MIENHILKICKTYISLICNVILFPFFLNCKSIISLEDGINFYLFSIRLSVVGMLLLWC
jgi:hypothetical protein